MAAVGNASLGNLFLTIKADAAPALRDIKKVIVEAERAAKAVDALNKAAGRVQAPKTPTAPRTPSAPKTPAAPKTPSRPAGSKPAANDPAAALENRTKALSKLLADIKLGTNAGAAEAQLDALRKRADKIRRDLADIRPTIKTTEGKAALDALEGKIEKIKAEARDIRAVVKYQPEKVAEAGTVSGAVKAAAEEEKAAQRAAAAKTKAANDAATAQQKANDKAAAAQQKAADKAIKDAQRQADKAARDAQRQADKAARDTQRAADKAARDSQRIKDRTARDTQRAADKAQREASKAAQAAKKDSEKAARDAQKLAEKTAAKFKSGLSGLTSGVSKNFSKSLADGFAGFASSAAALRYGNIFGGIASGARAIFGVVGNATKTVGEFGEAVGEASVKGGPFGVIIGVVAAGALVTIAGYAAKAAISFANFAAQTVTVGKTLQTLFTTGFQGAGELEKSGLTLEAVLGRRADAEKKYLIQRDRASLYDYTGLQDLDRTLLAFNVTNDETRRGLVDTLVTLGTVGGRSVDQLGFAARALGQISANGTPLRQDILQLVQSLGVSEKVLQSLPEYAGKSSAELRKLLEQGLIPSTTFFKALGVYAEQFGPIAAKAAGTFEGQVNNIKDTFRTGLSQAFLDTGVLDAAAKLANRVLKILETIDFKPIGAGFAAVIQAISQGLGGLTNSQGATSIKSFFEVTLPNILYKVAYLANFVAQVFSSFFQQFIGNLGNGETKIQTFGDGALKLVTIAASIAKGFAYVYAVLRAVFAIAKSVASPLTGVFRIVAAIIKAFFKLIKGDLNGALKEIGNGFRGIFDDINPVDDLQRAQKDYEDFVKGIDAATANAGKITFEPFVPTPPTGDGLPDQGQPPASTEDTQKKIEDLRNQLYDLTRRIYGLRSELEKGLIGEVGFDATKEQIAQIGDQVTDILRQLGKGGLAAAIDRQVLELMRLADLRDAVAKELQIANKRLEEAIKARDDFADQIRKQAIDFVNALKLEEETVNRVSTFKVGGITGYLVAQVKESQKYVDVLRKRLNTFRDFQKKTKDLAKRGLDKGVLEQLVAAGPEQAGTIVDQLVSSGDDVIREVNSIQTELGQVAKEAGTSQAALFFQAGVDQAQAQAQGLLSQIEYLSSVAELLGQAIYNAVVPFAEKTGAAVAAAVSTPVKTSSGGGGAVAKTPAPAKPKSPARNPLAELLLAAQKQINDSITLINARTQQMVASGKFSQEQIQNERKFRLTDLVKRYPGLIKVPGSDGFNIDVYLGGEKIATYVDIALRDQYGRSAAGRRQGVAPGTSTGESAPRAPGTTAPNPFGNGKY